MARKGYGPTAFEAAIYSPDMQFRATLNGYQTIQGLMAFSWRGTSATIPIFLMMAAAAVAQTASPESPAAAGAANGQAAQAADASVPQEDKRIFGVLPNNRTADGSTPYAPR